MRIKRTIGLLYTCVCLMSVHAQQVEWFSSTDANYWQKQKAPRFSDKNTSSSINVDVSQQKEQLIEGLGGCFNEKGWDALSVLDEKERKQIIHNLFSPQESNYTYCRMPIGASDYGLSFYSLNDVADDFEMINFNIDRDRYIMIPYIRAAQKVNPDLKVWASPWCPPAWMKTNNHYASNIDEGEINHNGLPREKILELPTTGFKMQYGYLKAYALYFTKFIHAYAKEGIDISAVNVQNEPCSNHKFPSCNWRPEDLAYFIGNFLGPKFEEEKITSDIYFGTINRDNPNYTRAGLNDPKAARYIKGAGFQWDGKWAIETIHKEYPQLKLMQTEAECGNGSNDWNAAEHTWKLMSHYFRNGVNSYAYWNMVLDHTGESAWGWKQNALISINKETRQVTYNPEYYLMKHLCHYVVPGAYRLQASGSDDLLAFENPDGTLIIITVNREEEEKEIIINIQDKKLPLSLKGKSFNTLYISETSNRK